MPTSAARAPHGDFSGEATDQVARLAAKPLYPLSLADLVRHGRPPLSAEQLLASARFTLSLLPVRLARRIQALRNLPYIVVSNPHIRRIFDNYTRSLSALLPYQGADGLAIETSRDEAQFTEVLADLVRTHTDTIPGLAKGFLECRRYMAPSDATRFLDEHLRARIGTRLVAEQHIALHYSSLPPAAASSSGEDHARAATTVAPQQEFPALGAADNTWIGVIDTALRPATIVNAAGGFVADMCELEYGIRPEWVIDGDPAATLAHIPMHLEYVVTELLKNAFRATVENAQRKTRRLQRTERAYATHRPEPVVITIAPEPPNEPAPLEPQSLPKYNAQGVPGATAAGNAPHHTPPTTTTAPLDEYCPGVTIRIRDRGGGIEPDILPHIWGYSFTTFRDDDDSIFSSGNNPGSTTNTSLPSWNTAGSGGGSGGGGSVGGGSGNSDGFLGKGGGGSGVGSGRGGGGGGGADALSGLIAGANGGIGSSGSTGGVSVGVGGTSSIAGLGYGLPLSRAYAEHFGGGIAVQSLYGWGTDVYLRLKGVGRIA